MFTINFNALRKKIALALLPKEEKELPIRQGIMVDGTRISADEAIRRFEAQRSGPPAAESKTQLSHKEF